MKGWLLITGAAKRIGRLLAIDLAKAGWDIVVHYHTSQAEAAILAEEIQALGHKACLVEMNLANEKAVAKLIPQLSAELGPLKALINNASRFLPDALDDSPDLHQAINVTAPRLLSEAFYETHQGKHWPYAPVIINLLDASATAPEFQGYNVSREVLRELTTSMAMRFAPLVRVNGVALGPVLQNPRESDEHFTGLVEKTPLRKQVGTEDVLAAVRFLLECTSVTGEILHVDSGAHLVPGT